VVCFVRRRFESGCFGHDFVDIACCHRRGFWVSLKAVDFENGLEDGRTSKINSPQSELLGRWCTCRRVGEIAGASAKGVSDV
jgi:hypothetical protein